MDDLIVYDEEYQNYSDTLEGLSVSAEEQLEAYLESLSTVCESVITEGRVANNLKTFLLCAKGMKGITGERITAMRTALANYVSEIDTADEYIY